MQSKDYLSLGRARENKVVATTPFASLKDFQRRGLGCNIPAGERYAAIGLLQ